ncbi:hypothetical protein K4L44_01470 [Halosquirtibacter laminarini]|uniref:Uncharacterized protein n=1 Tax=Halosquirtibacter laminarini TaxID=3374600 RepID=A0AC61NG31_9BACT|nr:hypothetical protein K4L44_01470 [Prolixibacteraceae bacterium]
MFSTFNKVFKISLFIFLITLIPTHTKASLKDSISLGGALRFNYRYKAWDQTFKDKKGDFVFDMFAIKANATYNKFFLKAEYRFYPSNFGGSFLKEGYVGYRINSEQQIVIGTTQVPFGITPYTSHSYFFNMQYYAGFEDDYDNGIKWTYNNQNFILDLAYFKNAEGNSNSTKRYSYDPVGNYEEIGQWNAKIEKPLGNISIGASGQFGKIRNATTTDITNSWATEAHFNGNFLSNKQLNVRLEAMYYNYEDIEDHQLTMGAYNSSYDVASEASIYSVAVAYTIPVKAEYLDYIQVYNDYSYMKKSFEGFNDSQMNVTGMMLAAGPIYTYIDYAIGKNQDWFGPWGEYGPDNSSNGMAQGDVNPDWHAWFNINIGYYF